MFPTTDFEAYVRHAIALSTHCANLGGNNNNPSSNSKQDAREKQDPAHKQKQKRCFRRALSSIDAAERIEPSNGLCHTARKELYKMWGKSAEEAAAAVLEKQADNAYGKEMAAASDAILLADAADPGYSKALAHVEAALRINGNVGPVAQMLGGLSFGRGVRGSG